MCYVRGTIEGVEENGSILASRYAKVTMENWRKIPKQQMKIDR